MRHRLNTIPIFRMCDGLREQVDWIVHAYTHSQRHIPLLKYRPVCVVRQPSRSSLFGSRRNKLKSKTIWRQVGSIQAIYRCGFCDRAVLINPLMILKYGPPGATDPCRWHWTRYHRYMSKSSSIIGLNNIFRWLGGRRLSSNMHISTGQGKEDAVEESKGRLAGFPFDDLPISRTQPQSKILRLLHRIAHNRCNSQLSHSRFRRHNSLLRSRTPRLWMALDERRARYRRGTKLWSTKGPPPQAVQG